MNSSQNAENQAPGQSETREPGQTPNLVRSETDELRVYDRPNRFASFKPASDFLAFRDEFHGAEKSRGRAQVRTR
jgi:hypothetical protein